MFGYQDVVPYNQFDPIFPPTTPYRMWNPWENTRFNPLLQFGLSALSSQITGATGGAEMGFGYGGGLQQNLQQQFQARQAMALSHAALVHDMQANGPGHAAFRTAFNLAGIDASAADVNLSAMARGAAGQTVSGLLAAGIGTGIYDTALAGRSIRPMYEQVFQAGLNRIDPFTGRRGYSVDTVKSIGDELYQHYGFDSPTEYMARARGLTSGQIGGLYGELSRRGMFEGGGFSKRTDGQVDMQKVGQKMEAWTDALAAVNDLFTSQGKYNTSTSELFAALEQLTMGANYSVDPQRISRMFGDLTNAAKLAGVGGQAIEYMMRQAGAQAQQMGLVSAGEWGMRATTGALTFQAAAGDVGLYSQASYGAASPQRVMAMRQQLELNNSNSRAMRTLGLMRRSLEQFGVKDQAAAGQVREILDKATAGVADDRLIGDYTQLLNLTARATGRSQAEINEMFTQTTANEQSAAEANYRLGLVDATRKELVRDTFGLFGRSVFARAATEAGLRGTGSQRVADRLSREAQAVLTDERNLDLIAKLRARGDGTEVGNRQAAAQQAEARAALGNQLLARAEAAARAGDQSMAAYLRNLARRPEGAAGELGNQFLGAYNQAEGAMQNDPRFRGTVMIDYLRGTSNMGGAVQTRSAETEMATLTDHLIRGSGAPRGDIMRRIAQAMQMGAQGGRELNWRDVAIGIAARAGNIANPNDPKDPTIQGIASALEGMAQASRQLDQAQLQVDERAAEIAKQGGDSQAYRDTMKTHLDRQREVVAQAEARWNEFLEDHPELKKRVEDMQQQQDAQSAAASNEGATITLNIGTLNLDKAGVVIKDASGTGKGETKTESKRQSAGGRG